MTPIPQAGAAEERGVVGGGAVGSRLLGRARIFRYEIRRWSNGVIPDIGYAVDSPVVVSTECEEVWRVLDLLPEVPPSVWGRDEAHVGEMWNSNSVVSWTLERAGLADRAGRPPRMGRAPGWDAGITVARRLRAPARRGVGVRAANASTRTRHGALTLRWAVVAPCCATVLAQFLRRRTRHPRSGRAS